MVEFCPRREEAAYPRPPDRDGSPGHGESSASPTELPPLDQTLQERTFWSYEKLSLAARATRELGRASCGSIQSRPGSRHRPGTQPQIQIGGCAARTRALSRCPTEAVPHQGQVDARQAQMHVRRANSP